MGVPHDVYRRITGHDRRNQALVEHATTRRSISSAEHARLHRTRHATLKNRRDISEAQTPSTGAMVESPPLRTAAPQRHCDRDRLRDSCGRVRWVGGQLGAEPIRVCRWADTIAYN